MGCGLISHHIKIDAKNQGSRDENCGGVLGCLLACSISPDKKVLAAEKKHRALQVPNFGSKCRPHKKFARV